MKSVQHHKIWAGAILAAAATTAGSLLAGGCKAPGNAGGAAGNSGAAVATVNRAKPYSGSDWLIGEYGAMTGDQASFGVSTDNAIQMAFSEINARGGVLGKQLRIRLENDDSKPAQAGKVALKLITSDNVLAVLGEVASSSSLAAAPVCQRAGVPMISPTSTNPKVTQVGNYIFRTCFIDPFQGTVASKFARETLHAKTAAILTDKASDYSNGLTQFFAADFTKNGGKIVAQAGYTTTDKEFHAQLTQIKEANPDIIYIPGYYNAVGNIAVQARSLDIKQPLLGGDGWDSPKLLEIGKDAVQGCYFSSHYSSGSKDPKVVKFVAAYKARYDGQTPDALAAVAYDAAYILADAIKRGGGGDRDKLRDAIAATKNFPGVTGVITIDKDRNAVKPAVILQVKGKEFAYVQTVNP